MIFASSDFDAGTHPVCLAVPPKIGMTTGPATPFLPWWMCEAFGLSMPDHLSVKQTLPFDGSRVSFAVPVPFGSPFGFSDLPLNEMLYVLFEAANDVMANTSSATSASDMTTSFFMARSSRRHRPMYIGQRS